MDPSDICISTPVNKSCRNLGLRRTKFKHANNESPAAKILSTPGSGKLPIFKTLTPNYANHASPSTTPVQATTVRRISASTGQYKLSFNRGVRDRFRKKRLNFVHSSPVSASSDQKENVSDNIPENKLILANSAKYLNKGDSRSSQEEQYLNAGEDSECDRKSGPSIDEAEVAQLKELIRIWRNAFTEAIADLSAKSNASEEEFLDELQIPTEMLQYLGNSK